MQQENTKSVVSLFHKESLQRSETSLYPSSVMPAEDTSTNSTIFNVRTEHKKIQDLPPPQSTRIESNTNNIKPNIKKCYTCYPKRLAKQHIFYKENSVSFHFDMLSRPLIIITPDEHILSLYEMSAERLKVFLDTIDTFCRYWNLKDYQLQINNGSWKNHEHLHIKMKANENFIQKLRSDHFRVLKLRANMDS